MCCLQIVSKGSLCPIKFAVGSNPVASAPFGSLGGGEDLVVLVQGAGTGKHLKMAALTVGKTQQCVVLDGDDEMDSDLHLPQLGMALNLGYSESDGHNIGPSD